MRAMRTSTAVGPQVPATLRATRKGGIVACAGIHMSPIPSFDYALLWGERQIRSVANLTRADGESFFRLITRPGSRSNAWSRACRESRAW